MEQDRILRPRPLTGAAFAPFGDVLEARGAADRMINEGRCGRFHDRARIDVEGRVGLSIFQSRCVALPYRFALVERHPRGSQAFVPMSPHAFLVIVAADAGGAPERPLAFVAGPGQGVNIARNVWHGVLAPLAGPGLFAVVDKCDEGPNLEEFRWDADWIVPAEGLAI